MKLVIFIGLQASGKSSFYRARFAATHQLVSKDLMPHNRRKARRQEEFDRGGAGGGTFGRGR